MCMIQIKIINKYYGEVMFVKFIMLAITFNHGRKLN